jgi:HD-like signal output (HDOD) protein
MTAARNESTSPIRPEDLVKGSLRLVSLPEIVIKVSRMVDDPRCSGAAIAQAIGTDPALAARLLRIANSPFYGFPSRIETLARAVTVIGTRGLRDLVLATTAIRLISRLGVMDMRAFWRHSLLCGMGARILAARAGLPEPEALFVSGLLHDVGQVIILMKLPEMGRETRMRAEDCGLPLHLLERSVMGFDHADVGGELLRQWMLPRSVWEAVKHHHDPAGASDILGASIVRAADILSHQLFDARGDAAEAGDILSPALANMVGLDAERLEDYRREVLAQFEGLGEDLLAAA